MARNSTRIHITKRQLEDSARRNRGVDEYIYEAVDRLLEETAAGLQKIAGEKLAEIQEGRFANDGAYNGHEKWAENTEATKKISGIGKNKKPLQQSGNLKNILTDPDSWDKGMLLTKGYGGFKIEITTPAEAVYRPYSWNEYNYIQPNIYKVISEDPSKFRHTARPYIELTDQDMDEVTEAMAYYIFQLLSDKL